MMNPINQTILEQKYFSGQLDSLNSPSSHKKALYKVGASLHLEGVIAKIVQFIAQFLPLTCIRNYVANKAKKIVASYNHQLVCEELSKTHSLAAKKILAKYSSSKSNEILPYDVYQQLTTKYSKTKDPIIGENINVDLVNAAVKDKNNPHAEIFRNNEIQEISGYDSWKINNYFSRLTEILVSPDLQPTCYEEIIGFQQQHPFVEFFCSNESDIDSIEKLIAEIGYREEALDKLQPAIEVLTPSEVQMIKHLLQTYPNTLSDHKELEHIACTLPEKIGSSTSNHERQDSVDELRKELKRMGWGLGHELTTMFNMFSLRRETFQAIDSPIEPKTEEVGVNRNALYILNANDPKIIVKAIGNPKHLQCEIAAREMAELAGLDSVVLPSIAGYMGKIQYDENGDICPTPIEKKDKQGNVSEASDRVFAQKFVASESGLQIYQKIMQGITGRVSWSLRASNQSLKPDVQKFTSITDPVNFEKNILLSFIVGDQDANPGNTLFSQKDGATHLYSIDHETIMPESNTQVDKTIPVVVSGEMNMQTGEITNSETIDCTLHNVFPMRCWLLGLPQSKKPFSLETMQYILSNLRRENFEQYHRAKNLFSDKAVNAQLERIDLILKLFSEEITKDEITLTPQKLFLEFMAKHPSYDILKNQLKLSDFLLYLSMGYIPATPNSFMIGIAKGLVSADRQKHNSSILFNMDLTLSEITKKNSYLADAMQSFDLDQQPQNQMLLQGIHDLKELMA